MRPKDVSNGLIYWYLCHIHALKSVLRPEVPLEYQPMLWILANYFFVDKHFFLISPKSINSLVWTLAKKEARHIPHKYHHCVMNFSQISEEKSVCRQSVKLDKHLRLLQILWVSPISINFIEWALANKKFLTRKYRRTIFALNNTCNWIGEKPFTCAVCDKGFTRKQELPRHERIPTGKKPFTCAICEKGFTWNDTLQRHGKIHTEEKPAARLCRNQWRYTRGSTLEKSHSRVQCVTRALPYNDCICRTMRGSTQVKSCSYAQCVTMIQTQTMQNGWPHSTGLQGPRSFWTK